MTVATIVGIALLALLINAASNEWKRQKSEERAERGRLLHEQGRYAEAEREYAAAIGLAPGDPRFRTGRGRALAALGRRRDALDEYHAATRLDRGSSAAHVDVARALLLLGHPQDALASAERAARLSPLSPEARLAKGEALLALGMREGAIAEMRESARMRDGTGLRTRIAALLRMLERHDEELAELDRAVAVGGESADLHYRRGCALWLIGKGDAGERPRRYREAVAAFEAALGIDRNHVEASMALEHARAQLEGLEGAGR